MFHITLAEGLVSRLNNSLCIKTDSQSQPKPLEGLLAPLVDQQINIAFHYFPPDGLDESRWGFGSCTWQDQGGGCPIGHHEEEHRLRMLSVKAEGVLKTEAGLWFIEQFDGKTKKLPLPLLEGHYARIVAAPVVDVEAMRARIAQADLGQFQHLGIQAEALRGVLERIKQATAEVKKGGENG